MNYLKIRKLHYKTQREKHIKINADFDDWLFSPYHCLKVRFFIEWSALLVGFLQFTPITPNFITLLFALSAIIGGILLASGENILIIYGVIIFFFNGIFDWMDGILARITKKTSELGDILDTWGGVVGSFSFSIGLGIYLHNATQEIHFIYFTIIIILIRALDLKDFVYHYLMYDFYKSNKTLKKNKKTNIKNKKSKKVPTFLLYIKKFFQSFLDNRARTIDTIGLIILIELYYGRIILSNYILYLILVKVLVIFSGGFYLVFFKDLTKKIKSSLN